MIKLIILALAFSCILALIIVTLNKSIVILLYLQNHSRDNAFESLYGKGENAKY